MSLTIRNEQAADVGTIRRLNEQAFGQWAEADLVDALRRSHALTVSLVAEVNGKIAGHIAFSPLTIESRGSTCEALALAPLEVLPEYQNRGIGSSLVHRGLEDCKVSGHGAVIVLGDPAYYPRFGFVPAATYGIRCPFVVPAETFMAAELAPGALAGCEGIVRYRPEFDAVSL